MTADFVLLFETDNVGAGRAAGAVEGGGGSKMEGRSPCNSNREGTLFLLNYGIRETPPKAPWGLLRPRIGTGSKIGQGNRVILLEEFINSGLSQYQ